MKPERTLIMLAYHFPPLGGVAVMRALRFSRYLPEFGWKPVVVCVDGGGNEPRDQALTEEIGPDTEVHRIKCMEPDNYADTWDTPAEKVIRNLFKTFDFVLFPDDRALWIGPAARTAARLAREKEADLVWATAQPWSTLLAGLKAHRATGLPLVSDFRDDWTTSNADFRRHNPRRQAREEALERQVLEACSAVVSVTPGIVEALTRRRPVDHDPGRYRLLENGFDPAHFATQAPPRVDHRFVILHAGGIYPRRSPEVFLEGLRRFLDGDPERRKNTVVRFAGRIDPITRPLLEAPDLAGVVETPGFLPHREVRDAMIRADVLLLLLEQVQTANWLYTGKFFEYVGARRPILSLGPPDSPLADLVSESGAGTVVGPGQVEATAAALERLYEERHHPALPHPGFVDRFDARRQTGELARILEACLP